MNQFKNGTLLVAIATVVVAVLILMTGRDTNVPSKDEHIVDTKNEVSQPKVAANNTEEKQIENLAEETTQSEVNTNVAKIAAPKGPFNKVESDKLTNIDVNTIVATTVAPTSNENEVLNHMSKPIWMDQKLGDFKSVEEGDVVFKMMPSNPDGLQGENPKQVVTSKSDKFAPTTVSANYNYQQMPMYNGGYYIAPMPSYLMSSMLPGKAVVENKK